MKLSHIILAVNLFSLVSCAKTSTFGEGTLALQDVDFQQPVASVIPTRAIDSSLAVEILSSDGSVYDGMSYAAGASVPAKFILPVGQYTLHCYSENLATWASENGGLGGAAFESSTPFNIENDYITYLNVKVPMVNFGVTLSLPEGFSQWFVTAELSVTAAGITHTITERAKTYFAAGADDFTYTLHLVNTSGETYDLPAGSFPNPASGTLYEIACSFGPPETSSAPISYLASNPQKYLTVSVVN